MILYVSVTLVMVLVLALGTAFFVVVYKRRRNQLQGWYGVASVQGSLADLKIYMTTNATRKMEYTRVHCSDWLPHLNKFTSAL